MQTSTDGRWSQTGSVLGIPVGRVNYDTAVRYILDAGKRRESRSVSALAVHGVMTGVLDEAHGDRLRTFDLIVPDGQPVRWALNLLDKEAPKLRNRVYGPELTLRLCAQAEKESVPIFLYGSTAATLEKLRESLLARYPQLKIAGTKPSWFREPTEDEDAEDVADIAASGAQLVFVGLGCPLQERWAYEHRGRVNAPMVCVGAAFDFHAGNVPQAPSWMQRHGLEWLYRLTKEPRRLWRRYVLLNPAYVLHVVLQLTGLRRYPPAG